MRLHKAYLPVLMALTVSRSAIWRQRPDGYGGNEFCVPRSVCGTIRVACGTGAVEGVRTSKRSMGPRSKSSAPLCSSKLDVARSARENFERMR